MASSKLTQLSDDRKESSGNLRDVHLLHSKNFNVKQVSYICYLHCWVEAEFCLWFKKQMTVMKHKYISYPLLLRKDHPFFSLSILVSVIK